MPRARAHTHTHLLQQKRCHLGVATPAGLDDRRVAELVHALDKLLRAEGGSETQATRRCRLDLPETESPPYLAPGGALRRVKELPHCCKIAPCGLCVHGRRRRRIGTRSHAPVVVVRTLHPRQQTCVHHCALSACLSACLPACLSGRDRWTGRQTARGARSACWPPQRLADGQRCWPPTTLFNRSRPVSTTALCLSVCLPACLPVR